LHESASLGLKS